MRSATIETRRRLYLLARVVIARHYRRPLTLTEVAAAVSSSPRQLQRAYAQFGLGKFRMVVIAVLMIGHGCEDKRNSPFLSRYSSASLAAST